MSLFKKLKTQYQIWKINKYTKRRNPMGSESSITTDNEFYHKYQGTGASRKSSQKGATISETLQAHIKRNTCGGSSSGSFKSNKLVKKSINGNKTKKGERQGERAVSLDARRQKTKKFVIPNLLTLEQLVTAIPASASCPTPDKNYADECRTASQALPFINKSFQDYNITTRGLKATVLSLISVESGGLKFRIHHFPAPNPGQGTFNQMNFPFIDEYVQYIAKTDQEIASKYQDLKSKYGAGYANNDQAKNDILALVLPDKYAFASATWFLRTKCSFNVINSLENGTGDVGKQAYKIYLTDCIGTSVTDQRLQAYDRAISAFLKKGCITSDIVYPLLSSQHVSSLSLSQPSIDVYGYKKGSQTREYLIVAAFHEKGNLKIYLSQYFSKLNWEVKLNLLVCIGLELQILYEVGLTLGIMTWASLITLDERVFSVGSLRWQMALPKNLIFTHPEQDVTLQTGYT
ncbi:hypothetical protein G9A89_023274 [Geosiphon pyriformis]|nr:hypothetical protein G9A89_023274 [Geosiphon pyriformis]